MKICYNTSCSAGVAHPVERHLAKVEVASSSLVTRSKNLFCRLVKEVFFFCNILNAPAFSRGIVL